MISTRFGQYMPRYSTSNVPTAVAKNTPDPVYFGGDWGIYQYQLSSKPNSNLGSKFPWVAVHSAFLRILLPILLRWLLTRRHGALQESVSWCCLGVAGATGNREHKCSGT